MSRRVTIAAAVFIAVTACAYLGLVLAFDWILHRANMRCSDCVARSQDPLLCDEHRADFALLRLVPWRNEDADGAANRCLTRVHDAAIQWATLIEPDAAKRDAVLARIDEPTDSQLYLAGAFDRLIERGGRHLLIDEAMQLRSLELVKRAASLPTEEEVGRRAAWLCLLGERERGLELMRRWVALNENAPPDMFPTGWLAPLGLYACGGERVDGVFGTDEPMTLLRIERGELDPKRVLRAETEWSPRARRFALAHTLERSDPMTLDVFEWLVGTTPRELTCSSAMLEGPAVPIDPHVALRAAERLLAWVAADGEAILELQGRLPARALRVVGDEGETDAFVQMPADLIAYVRRVARDLHWDAGEAFFARGELAQGHAAFEAAIELGARRCAFTSWLAGETPLGEEPESLPERVVWLDGQGRDADTFAAIEAGPEPWRAWWRAALGLRLGIDTPGARNADSSAAWWHAVHTHDSLNLRRAVSRDVFANVLRPVAYRARADALAEGPRFETTGRANVDADADLFHAMFATRATSRSALWAKARAAHRLGQPSAAEHQTFYEEVAALASTPANALLLTTALDDWPEGNETLERTDEPPWAAPVFNDRAGCPRRVWAHFEGIPARDDAELAFRYLAREQLAAESTGATYVVRARVTQARIEGDVVRAQVRAMEHCETGPSSRSGNSPFENADLALDEEPEAFWDRHFVPDGDVVLLTLGPPSLRRIHGIWIWEAEPIEIEAEANEMIRELLQNVGRADVDLVVRATSARSDPRGGPRIEAEIVEARVGREREGWVRASPTRTPQTPGED